MKNFLSMMLIFIMLFISVSSFSQTAFKQTASNPTGAITNTSTDTMTIAFTNSYHAVSVEPVISKASGTMAGKAYLDYSVNGTNYVVIDSASIVDAATNYTIWTHITPAKYWRIRIGGATTVTGTASAKVSVE